MARAESVRGEAGAAARGAPARAAARQGSVAARVPAPAVALLQRLQRAGRGARGTGSAPAGRRCAGRGVLRRAGALHPRAQQRVARRGAGARVAEPPPRHRPLLPLQDVRLQVPLLLLRTQAPQALPRGREPRTKLARTLHLQRVIVPPPDRTTGTVRRTRE